MSGSTLGLIELLLVFGGVLGWGVWELWSLRRSRASRQTEIKQQPATNSTATATSTATSTASNAVTPPTSLADTQTVSSNTVDHASPHLQARSKQ